LSQFFLRALFYQNKTSSKTTLTTRQSAMSANGKASLFRLRSNYGGVLVLATAQLVPLLEVLDQRVEFIAFPVKISHPVLSDLPWSTAGGPRAEI
jgi:hypothetical protein